MDSIVGSFSALSSTMFESCFGFVTMMMEKRRASPRHRVLKGGRIAFAGRRAICTVRNVSAGGAAIDLAEHIHLPQSFTLLIERDQFMRRCRPVWSRERRVGVAFC